MPFRPLPNGDGQIGRLIHCKRNLVGKMRLPVGIRKPQSVYRQFIAVVMSKLERGPEVPRHAFVARFVVRDSEKVPGLTFWHAAHVTELCCEAKTGGLCLCLRAWLLFPLRIQRRLTALILISRFVFWPPDQSADSFDGVEYFLQL